MLNRDEGQKQADRVTDKLEETEQKLLVSIARQARVPEDVTRDNIQEWQAQKQAEAVQLQRRNTSIAIGDLRIAARELAEVREDVADETGERQDDTINEATQAVFADVL